MSKKTAKTTKTKKVSLKTIKGIEAEVDALHAKLDKLGAPRICAVSLNGKMKCATSGDPLLQLGMVKALERLVLKNIKGLD